MSVHFKQEKSKRKIQIAENVRFCDRTMILLCKYFCEYEKREKDTKMKVKIHRNICCLLY